MKKNYKLYLSIVLIVFSFIVANSIEVLKDSSFQAKKVQRTFDRKVDKTQKLMEGVRDLSFSEATTFSSGAITDGISLLGLRKDSLVFWSNNEVPIRTDAFDSLAQPAVFSLANSTFFVIPFQDGDLKILGLIQLASNFPYENKFLRNGLHSSFNRFKAHITEDINEHGTYPIYYNKDELVFSVKFDAGEDDASLTLESIATAILMLGFLLFFVYLRGLVVVLVKLNKKSIIATIIGVFALRVMLIVTNCISSNFYYFDPYVYATPLAPTFGDLILNTMFLLFVAYLVFRYFNIPERLLNNAFNRNAWVGIVNVILILVLGWVNKVSLSIITDSSINLNIHNISEISVATVIAYTILATHYFSLYLIILWIFRNLKDIRPYKLYINFAVLLLSFYTLAHFTAYNLDGYTVLFTLIVYVVTPLIIDRLYARTIFSSLVFLLFIFSVYVIAFTFNNAEKKDKLIKRSFVENLANEHDPVAEYQLEDISKSLMKDDEIPKFLDRGEFDLAKMESFGNYLSERYFKGYLKKYQLLISLCQPDDSVNVNVTENIWYPCYDYYAESIENYGAEIPGSSFYYIDNPEGIIRYLGWLKYPVSEDREFSIIVELDSKMNLTSQPLGYPELLLDKKLKKSRYFDRFSYAKYYKGDLISHVGEYNYSLKSDVFKGQSNKDYYYLNLNGYDHEVFIPGSDTMVVLSEKELKLLDYIVIFSYVFVFYYLIALLAIVLLVSKYGHLSFKGSLRNRLQYSVVLILIASLIIIAGSTIIFNIRKYNQTQFRIIKEKIQSVYIELEHKLSYESVLTPDWSSAKYESLDQLLIKFSDVFYSDINLYSPEGNLLATSRPEIFQLGLQNQKMEPLAFYKMSNEKLVRFVHNERINNLKYLSAYIPFENTEGKMLAYLNLPYFTKQQELQEDITTLTIAIVNIYVLLILLTIVVAVFISNQITKPLEMLQSKFRKLKLGEEYEVIDYTRNDEIGRLVDDYNRMVGELEKSVGLLAKSERESAWREMAKQVAHEIKNPLTPMRLSVQQLQRAWNDRKENFEKYLLRVTETLIEQIDTLSKIASEFSNFAKMPVAHIERVNLIDVLVKSTDLFKGNEKVQVRFGSKMNEAFVEADSEQLSRVFINLIKNSIQAVPDSRKGNINIYLEQKNELAIISVSDNGKGIAKEISDKLFMPNFTTKSSGMGLGLSIVKKALEQIGGTIDFETVVGEGTTFVVSLRLALDESDM